MLKAIQILGSSSGFISQRLTKTRNTSSRFSIICISTRPLSSLWSPSRRQSTSNSSLLSASSARRNRCFRAIRVHGMSESDLDGESSSSSLATSSSVPAPTTGNVRKINFCQSCGAPTKHEIPDGEEKLRAICTGCGRIAYENPKIVVGCLIEHEKKVLLCKRNIQPSHGLWTLPAGYMEIGESAMEGAIRETWEEAGAEVEVISPFAQLDIPLIGQTYIIFLAKLKKPHFSLGPESSDCRLFALDDIPFDSLAFSSIFVSLNLYIEDVKEGRVKVHYGTINKRPGSRPSDIRAYTLDHHMQF